MSTDEKTSVLVVGGGSIGERHVRCFQRTGRADVWLCEISDDVRRCVADEYDLRRSYNDLHEAIDAAPHAAVVATPAHLHVDHTRRLAQKGCHVLIEKPLATDLDAARMLVEELEASDLVCAVAYVMRHHPALAALAQAVREQRFGDACQVVYRGGQDFPRMRPAYRTIYYRDRATGGGAVQDALTHTVNAVQWILGRADRVVADVAHLVLDGVEVEDTAHVLARHGDVLASYALNQHQAPNESSLDVHCAEGSFRFESHRHRLREMARGSDTWTDEVFDIPHRDTGFIAQADAFLDAVAGKRDVACTPREALATLQTCLGILESADHGRWVACGPPSPIR